VIFENENCQKRENNNFIHGKLKRKGKNIKTKTKLKLEIKAIKNESEKN